MKTQWGQIKTDSEYFSAMQIFIEQVCSQYDNVDVRVEVYVVLNQTRGQ